MTDRAVPTDSAFWVPHDICQCHPLKAGPRASAFTAGLGVCAGPAATFGRVVATAPEAGGVEDTDGPVLLAPRSRGFPRPVFFHFVVAWLDAAAVAERDEPDQGVEGRVRK